MNKGQKIIIGAINQYQKFFSNDHGDLAKRDNYVPYCKYYPSCSEYSKESIEKKGVLIGSLKSFWRILRCQPWSKGGYDPVDKDDINT